MKKSFLLSLIIFCIVVPGHIFAEDTRVTAALDKRSVQIDEEIHLSIRVIGASGRNIQAPHLPQFEGFDTFYTGRASHLTFINGVSTSSVDFSYTLVPKVAGSFLLDPIEIQVGNNSFQTEPVSIEVLGSSGKLKRTQTQQNMQQSSYSLPPSQMMQAPAAQSDAVIPEGEDKNLFVRAWLNKKSVYQNEQVLLTYSLYTRYDTRYEGFSEEPEVSGFWIENFPMDREIPRETVRIKGRNYIRADIKKMALFPTTATTYTILPGTIKTSIKEQPQSSSIFDEFFSDNFFSGGGFFSRRQDRFLKPEPIQIIAKPLPENGKPNSFSGAVGNFRVSATVDKKEVKQNEPVILKIVIEGDGNIEMLAKPKLPILTGFKIYESDTNAELFRRGNVIGGKKTFEIVFIPREKGQMYIPSLEFSYFDPVKGEYVVQDTPSFPLEVEESKEIFNLPDTLSRDEFFKKNVELEAKDIRFIHEKLPNGGGAKGFVFFYRFLQIGSIFLFVVLAGLLFRDYERKLFRGDVALRRRREARVRALSAIKKLKKLAHSKEKDNTNIFFEETEKAMTQYLADKWNLPTLGITRTDLERRITESLGGGDPLVDNIVELYQLCDESRFAKAQVPQASKNMVLKIFKQTIERVEKVRR